MITVKGVGDNCKLFSIVTDPFIPGTVNLNNERLDITIFAHPKDVSALSANSPLHLGGTFNKPDFGVQTADLVLQAGSSAVLAALATPIAALLPLLDFGTGDEIRYCNGLVSRSLQAIDDTSENERGG